MSTLGHIAKQFPILQRKVGKKKLVYFDNAAMTQLPQAAVDAMNKYYTRSNANVHRGIHTLGEEATELYEKARRSVADFINAPSEKNIVFVKNTTEGLNLLANGFAAKRLSAEDTIAVSVLEHHSNYIPWLLLSKKTGCRMHTIPMTKKGYLDIEAATSMVSDSTKFISVTHMSNVLGTIQPIENMIALAKKNDSFIILDGAQAVSHLPVDVQSLDVDAYIFSGHKIFGPTGIGVVYAKDAILSELSPQNPGGGTILDVTDEQIVWNDAPYRFEGGTPHIAGAVGLAAAIRWLHAIDVTSIIHHEQKLTQRAIDILQEHKSVRIFGDTVISERRGPVISFSMENIHPHDIASILDEEGIAIRAGHHCAKPLMYALNIPATARVSFSIYNTVREVEKLDKALTKVERTLL